MFCLSFHPLVCLGLSPQAPSLCRLFMHPYLCTVIESQNKHSKPWRSVCTSFLSLHYLFSQLLARASCSLRHGSVPARCQRKAHSVRSWSNQESGCRALLCLSLNGFLQFLSYSVLSIISMLLPRCRSCISIHPSIHPSSTYVSSCVFMLTVCY